MSYKFEEVELAHADGGKPDPRVQTRLRIHLDPRLGSEQPSPRQEHVPLSSTTGFNLDISSPSDRTALTRYTNQTITSLAAYRDALIDENARLNAMLIDARAGLVVLSNSPTETEFDNSKESVRAKRTMMDVVKESMLEEIKQLRTKAERLSEEERTIPKSGPVHDKLDASRGAIEASSNAMASAHEATSAIYYATINKLQDDLQSSKKRRDDAKTSLVAICRQPGASDRARVGSQRTTWRGKHGVNAMNAEAATSRDDAFEHEGHEQVPDVDYTEEPTDPNVDEALLNLITDQEEIVWMREKKEREMERAFRDMKCYVEAMIREWREIGSLPPPGKYQTISYPDLNLPYIPTQIFPKRKGRPPRASVKVHQQVPESLQHLVAKSRISQKARDFEKYRKHVPAMPYTLADDAVLRRLSRRNKGKGREMEIPDMQQEDAVAKRRRIMLGDHASDYTNEAADAISAAVRHGSLSASNNESLRPGATTPNGQQASMSAEHLYDVSASAISDAMQAYTQQPLPDENAVFGGSDMPGLDPADVAFDTQIPYQIQMVQRRALGYSGDDSVPGALVNGGNVFDHPDDVPLDGGDIVHQSPNSHDQDGQQYEPSNSFRTFDQATQDSVEGMIQQHIRDAQASVQDADSTLMQMQHVDNGNLETSDTQQALESYRFDEALMDHEINQQGDPQATAVLTTEVSADSADATAIAAQRLMNSLVPHATADFDPSCQNCGRRDTSVWRKLTVNGVDYKVCNACGLHYHKNGVMRPRALWGDIDSQPRKRRSQRPFGSSAAPSSEQHQHDLMMDEALYEEPNEEDELEHEPYGEGSYDVHYADGQYAMDEVEDNITAEDLPHYELMGQ